MPRRPTQRGTRSRRREILGLTNGVHGPTWIGAPIAGLLERYLDADLDDIDAASRGRTLLGAARPDPGHGPLGGPPRQKRELAIFARGRLRNQFARHGEAPRSSPSSSPPWTRTILTIGFARRFATYKRAGLIFSDIDRLARLLWDEKRPMQIVFAGKAHPADRPGQRVIQEIFQRSRSAELRGRVFILEDYDMRVARFLVQGVDVWLNNPRRPLEASGTSGMKAAQNGGRQRQRARRLVGRGLRRRQRVGHRRARDERRRGRPGLVRRAGPLPDPRGRDHPGVLRPRLERAAAALARDRCAVRWPRRCGASPRPACSTSTRSGCTCRRPACRSPVSTRARIVTEAG